MVRTPQRDCAGGKASGVLRDPTTAAGMGQFGAIQSVAPSFGIEINPVSLRDAGEIERGVTTFAATEWRSSHNRGPIGNASSQADHRACGPAQTAGDLLLSVF